MKHPSVWTRRAASSALCILWWCTPAHAQSLTEAVAVAFALQHSPLLAEPLARVRDAEADLAQAQPLLRNNPEVSASAGPRWAGSTAASGLDFEVAVDQRVELFGQQGLRAQAAGKRLQAAREELSAARMDLSASVRDAWAVAAAAGARAAATERADALASQALEAASMRLANGAATRLEVNAARAEWATAQRARLAARADRTAAMAALWTLMGAGPPSAGAPDPDALDRAATLDDEALTSASPSALADEAQNSRPELRAARLRVEAAQLEAGLAGREALPSPSLGAAYSREADEHIAQARLSFPLPLFDRNQAARGRAQAAADRAERDRDATMQRIRLEVAAAQEALRDAAEAAKVTRGEALQAAEENLQLATEAYQAGKIDFLQLLVVRRAALEERRAAIDASEALLRSRVRLYRALGRTP